MDLTPLIVPGIALLTGLFGLWIANRLGLGSVQQQYIEVVTSLSEKRQEKINEMEVEFSQCKERLDEAIEEVNDLRQEVFELRSEIAQSNRRPRPRRPVRRGEEGPPT